MHEQRANLVPEIAAQYEQAGQQHQVADGAKGEFVTDVAGNTVGEVRCEPAEENWRGKHYEPDPVADGADLGRSQHAVRACQGFLGDLGTRYYLSAGNLISGYSGSLAVSPESGDIVVILASNSQIPAWEFVHQTVSDWAPELD